MADFVVRDVDLTDWQGEHADKYHCFAVSVFGFDVYQRVFESDKYTYAAAKAEFKRRFTEKLALVFDDSYY